LLLAFDWASLPADSLLVDVGGGLGSVPRVLLQAGFNMKVVIQDLPGVIGDGEKVADFVLPKLWTQHCSS
jgi:hypothetical protein